MAYALFDVLRGEMDDGAPVRGAGERALIASIRDHLRRLFNARQGTIRHLPDHGLPDVPALYGGLPYSVDELAREIQRTVERYEPRLERVRVRVVPIYNQEAVLGIELAGRLPGGDWAHFQSAFHAGGNADVDVPVSARGSHERVF